VKIDTVKHNILFDANSCYYKLCESTYLCILYPPSLSKTCSYQLTLCTCCKGKLLQDLKYQELLFFPQTFVVLICCVIFS